MASIVSRRPLTHGRFASNAIGGMVIGSAISLVLWALIVVGVMTLF